MTVCTKKPVVYYGMRTPWGKAQSAQVIADGIGTVSTPGHGGVKLSPNRNRQVPEAWRADGGWYEEDCAYCVPFLLFDTEVCEFYAGADWTNPADVMEGVFVSARNWYPDFYEEVTGEKIPDGVSFAREEQRFNTENALNLIVFSAVNAGGGMVRCFARRGGRQGVGGESVYMIPSDEYKTRGRFGFIVDESKHLPI